MAFQCEKPLVYQKSLDFADQVCSTTEKFSRSYGFLFWVTRFASSKVRFKQIESRLSHRIVYRPCADAKLLAFAEKFKTLAS